MEKARETVDFLIENGLEFYNFEYFYTFKFGVRPTPAEIRYAEEIHYEQTSSYEDSYDSYDE